MDARRLGAYEQVTDIFAAARQQAFTGSLIFHLANGEPRHVEVNWRLSFGDQLRRFVRIFLGKPPPDR